MQRRREIAIHITIWSVILLLPYLLSSASQQYRIGGMPGSFFTIAGLIHAGIFYFNAFYLYPKLARGLRWWLYVPAAILLIALSLMLKYQLAARWYPDVLASGSAQFVFAPSLFVFIASLIYRRITDGVRKERIRKEHEAQQMAAELRFLRSQINPHFLFNVLTNMVSLARQKSDRLEGALIRLSDLMRYMTYDTQATRVTVQQEADYLQSYVELQKLRFSDSVRIEMHVNLDAGAGELPIEPMLLIPFVENAFKHGASRLDDPYIDIGLTVADGQLTLNVVNPFDENPDDVRDDSPGIGLENVRTRLRLLYPGRHQLSTKDSGNLFQVHFNLIL